MSTQALAADQIDATARALPGVTVDIKWGQDQVYSVCGKMFAVLDPLDGGLSFKVEDEHFLALTGQPGIVPAPYLARARWIKLLNPADADPQWLQQRLQVSYRLVAAKLSRAQRVSLGLVSQD